MAKLIYKHRRDKVTTQMRCDHCQCVYCVKIILVQRSLQIFIIVHLTLNMDSFKYLHLIQAISYKKGNK